jgi:hypothetical protein
MWFGKWCCIHRAFSFDGRMEELRRMAALSSRLLCKWAETPISACISFHLVKRRPSFIFSQWGRRTSNLLPDIQFATGHPAPLAPHSGNAQLLTTPHLHGLSVTPRGESGNAPLGHDDAGGAGHPSLHAGLGPGYGHKMKKWFSAFCLTSFERVQSFATGHHLLPIICYRTIVR